MGCWLATCGISRLPIEHGTPIRLCLIVGHPYKLADDNLIRNPGTWRADCELEFIDEDGVKHQYADREGKRKLVSESHAAKERNDRWREAWYSGLVYAADVFFPRCVPLKGKYNDYGGIDLDDNSVNITAVLDQFQLDLDEYPAGRFSIPVKISRDMSLGDLLHAIERGGVTVNRFKDRRPHSRGNHLPVATWMVREDIYQAVINAKIGSRWSDDGPFDLSTFYDAGETYRKGLAGRAKEMAEMETLFKHSGAGSDLATSYRALKGMVNHVSENVLLRAMRSPPFENGMDFYDTWLLDAVETKKLDPESDKVKSLIREIAEFSYFCIAKEVMRVAWMPQCGAGSQDERIEVHAAVAKQTLKTIELMLAERAGEAEDDE